VLCIHIGVARLQFVKHILGVKHPASVNIRHPAFDAIKLDRSLVARICDDPRSLAIGRAVIQMAHALKMVICAEGVETEAQYKLLQNEGWMNFRDISSAVRPPRRIKPRAGRNCAGIA
jgi:predicted signal transduction protein with EAL and GGDEF domain